MIQRLIPLLVFAALGVLLFVGVRMSGDPNRDALPSPLIGRQAPAFELQALHEPDRAVAEADLRGAPYLLNVWGSWCPACRDEHPVIERLAESGRIRVVGFNWKDEREDALRWLRQFRDPYDEIVVDQVGRVAIDWGVYGAPETFLVDAEGVIRWKHVGPMTDRIVQQQLLPMLAELEAGR